MKTFAIALIILITFARPSLGHSEALPGSTCEGVFKEAKYFVVKGPNGVSYIEGRSGDQARARYRPLKTFDAQTTYIQTGGIYEPTGQKYEDHFYPPAKFPGWGWVVRIFEATEDKTKFIWFGIPESEPSEILPISLE